MSQSSPINFGVLPTNAPAVLSREQCEVACLAPDGYFQAIFADDSEKSPEEIAECIKELVDHGYATCGETIETPESKTDKLLLLLKKYGFTPYQLKRLRMTNASSACEIQGWDQGRDDSDCWIDSFLFSIFVNDNLAPILIKDMTNKYNETLSSEIPHDIYMNNTVFCINLYLNLLRERKALYTKSVVSDIKGVVKWCAIWYMMKYFENTLDASDYESIKEKTSLTLRDLTIGNGGDPTLLSFFLSKVSTTFVANMYHSGTYSNNKEIIDYATAYPATTNKIVAISVTPLMPINEQYLSKIKNIKYNGVTSHSLEAINIGRSGHATAYTLCNGVWRYYDNKASPTTSMSTTEMATSKLDDIFRNTDKSVKSVLLIYRISSKKGGFTQKKKKRAGYTRKNRY